MTHELLQRLDTYFDAVPRANADVERLGPFSLFVARSGWPYYARPRRGPAHTTPAGVATPGITPADITPVDVRAVLDRQRALGVPQTFEWVDELVPSLTAAALAVGLGVTLHPLMVLDTVQHVPVPDGVRLRLVQADDPGMHHVRAVQHVGFSTPGTDVGAGGPDERDAAAGAQEVAILRERIRSGRTIAVAAEDSAGMLSVGMHQPADDASELVGIATLPNARRRGLAAAVADALASDARARGMRTVLLSAQDELVARVYERVGFRRVGTAGAAEPISSD